jgi:hypothetical protein
MKIITRFFKKLLPKKKEIKQKRKTEKVPKATKKLANGKLNLWHSGPC